MSRNIPRGSAEAQPGGIELIAFDQQDKKFVVKPEALKLLQRLQGPVSVIAVCGRARMGKSTLLNQLVLKLSGSSTQSRGFTVASTHKPCTKGLWIWSQPIMRMTADGRKMNVLLVDCEGIDAFDQTMDYSTQIFSLGLLLSSLLVFNQMGGIDESAIDKLSSVCEFAKLIQNKSTPGGSAAGVQELSPAFLWLLRDFQFQLTEDGHQISTGEYMEEVLRDMPGSAVAIKNRNQIRASIKSLFPQRDCFALVRPCLEESDLAAMDTLKLEQLRPEFRQGFDRLTDLVMSKAAPKQFKGQYITGSALGAFAQAYVDVINTGQVPTISSTWQSVMRSENQHALDAALAAYERAFANGQQQQHGTPGRAAGAPSTCPDLHEQLDATHAAALQVAMGDFEKQALGDVSERRAYELKLREQAGLRFAVVKQARLAEADHKIVDMLAAAGNKIMQLFHADPVDMAKFDSELAAVLQQYDAQASGPSKYKRAAEFLMNTVVRSLGDLAKKAQAAAAGAGAKLQAAKKEAAESQFRVTELSHRIKALENSESSLRQQLSTAQQEGKGLHSELAGKSTALIMAEARRDALQADLNQARQQAEHLERRATAAEAQAAELQAQLGAQRTTATQLTSQAADQARELTAARQELERHRAAAEAAQGLAQERVARLTADVARLQGELQLVNSKRDAAEAELASYRPEAARQLQARDGFISQLQAEVQELKQSSISVAELQVQNAHLAQMVTEKDVTAQRLLQERDFLQQQLDTVRRESLSPAPLRHGNTGLVQEQQQPQAIEITDVDTEAADMEVDEPNRKRRRVQAVRAAEGAAGEGARDVAHTPEPQAATGAAASPAPFSSERRVEISRRTTPSPAPATAANQAEGSGNHQEPSNLSRMTIQDIKSWLVDQGFEDNVFKFNSKKPAPKKQDWVDLVKKLSSSR